LATSAAAGDDEGGAIDRRIDVGGSAGMAIFESDDARRRE